jgi:Flp pilus assembly protein TadG
MIRKYILAQTKIAAVLRNREGVAAIEFAMIAPVFLVLLMGMLNVGQTAYGIAVLNGAVQKAARDAALEGADTQEADAMVKKMAGPIFPGATFVSKRTNYYDFSDIGRPEKFNDANNNSNCDNGEVFIDENRNGDWDRDVGRDGNGGASDVVVYTMEVQFKPVFRIPFSPDKWTMKSLSASALKKNQPFSDQEEYGTSSGTCTA